MDVCLASAHIGSLLVEVPAGYSEEKKWLCGRSEMSVLLGAERSSSERARRIAAIGIEMGCLIDAQSGQLLLDPTSAVGACASPRCSTSMEP